ncbi:hypothetical protein BDL97_06G089100 [Sphagnum fallax]|nr:hypothetical protein BDL97_06G089100 [Sphagnum fallax]
MELVARHGQQCWSVIATFLTGCIGKQCRKRGHNHLRLDIKVELKMPSRITGMQQLDGKIFATSTELKQQLSWTMALKPQINVSLRESCYHHPLHYPSRLSAV